MAVSQQSPRTQAMQAILAPQFSTCWFVLGTYGEVMLGMGVISPRTKIVISAVVALPPIWSCFTVPDLEGYQLIVMLTVVIQFMLIASGSAFTLGA